jgi:hypothetical protein
MYYFITLFDKNYLSRGLALYKSLIENCDDFILYVLAIDCETECYLYALNEKRLEIISLLSIEAKYPELLSIKKERTRGEYCWTLTPYCIQYALNTFNLDACTYLDADIYFFANPVIIIENVKNNAVIITEHRYSPEYDQTYTSGKYCVQFMYFKNNIGGRGGVKVLDWWRQRCFEWCYAKYENGKFGDQKYLDDWTTRFENIYVPAHIGCGLAPWNINQYDLEFADNRLYVQDKITKEKNIAIFYHFHGLRKNCASSGALIWHLGGYKINKTAKDYVYREYINTVMDIEKGLGKVLAMPVGDKKNMKKPSFFTVLWLVLKNILRSILIFRRYKHFKNAMIDKYNQFQDELFEFLLPEN